VKRYVGFLCFILLIPLSISTAEPSERQEIDAVIQTLDDLLNKWDQGVITQELYLSTSRAILGSSLARYPESVELLQYSVYLSIVATSIPEIARREAILDSVRLYYKQRWEENPNSVAYAYLYASRLNDLEERVKIAKTIIKKKPENYWGYDLLGKSLMGLERFIDAAQAFEQAAAADSTEGALSGLAEAYYKAGDYRRAYSAYRALYLKAPEKRKNYYQALSLAKELGDEDLLLDLNRSAISQTVKKNEDVLSDLTLQMKTLWDAYTKAEEPDSARYYKELGYALAQVAGGQTKQRYIFYMISSEVRSGNNEAAIDLIERLVEEGFTDYIKLKESEVLKALEGQPRYDSLMQVIKESRMADRINQPAPEFTLVSLDGDTVSLSDLRGKPVLLDFWGLGCAASREATPYLKEFYQKHAGEIHVIGIEVWGSDVQAIREYIEGNGVTYPVLIGSMELAKVYGFTEVPSFFFIDAEGNIAFERSGFAPVVSEEWELFLQTLLED
jgi:thiol-disulfide isomerase/thioredoxin